MEKEQIQLILDQQRMFFQSGKTFDIDFRLQTLRKLRKLIMEYEPEIIDALWKDFHKPEFEVVATETRFVLQEMNLAIRKLRRWSRPRWAKIPLTHFLSWNYSIPQPYGVVLILSPWNFPLQLSFVPLLGALAAGNCVILKTSRQVPQIGAVMEKILQHFPTEQVALIQGDHTISEYLLDHPFDYIFFTGSCRVGKYVMEKASRNLIPVSLELGGKNPCVVTASARLDYAARRIAWGKFMNAGQTCICPDFVMVEKSVKDRFITFLEKELAAFYGKEPQKSPHFPRVINRENVERLSSFLGKGEVVTGGWADPAENFFAPTILKNITPDDPVMQEEIFGPLLPVLDFEDFNEVYRIIGMYPKPLATYIFSTNKKQIREYIQRTQSGSVGINETVMQIASPYLPYGGVGCSGMGRYHGKKSFDTFSNLRAVLTKSNLLDIPLRYPPYSSKKAKLLKWIMR
jgi:aldehyde dehydrogenase (NAD+)